MTLTLQIYTCIVIAFIIWLFYVPIRNMFHIIIFWLKNPIQEEIPVLKIKIVTCSSPFFWYEKISKIKDDAPNSADKIFEVEYYDEKLYRTKIDTCGPGGPGVKGFINITDTETIIP